MRTASGARAAQIVHSQHRGSRNIEHIGSAHTDADLELLKAVARQRLADGQDELDLRLPGSPANAGAALPITSSRMGHLLDALGRSYDALGLGAAAERDEVFRALVLARIIEPTSKLDSLRVLEEAGISPPSYATVKRRLRVYATGRSTADADDPALDQGPDLAVGGPWRARLAGACAQHVGLGPATLLLYDVTTLYFETDEGDGFREPGFSKERRLEPQITVGVRHEAPCCRAGVRDPAVCLSQQVGEAESSLPAWRCCGEVASGSDEVGTCQHCQMVRVRRASREGIRKEPVFEASLRLAGSNLVDTGRCCGASRALPIGALPSRTTASRPKPSGL